MPNRRAVGRPRTGRADHRQDSYGSDERSFPHSDRSRPSRRIKRTADREVATPQTARTNGPQNGLSSKCPKQHWDALKRDIKQVYTAVSAAAAREAMDHVTEVWGARYPAIIRLWEGAWEQFIPFLDYDIEIRTVLYSTNAIESLNAGTGGRLRPAVTFPPSRPPLNASTWSPGPWTRPGPGGQNGPCGGSQP